MNTLKIPARHACRIAHPATGFLSGFALACIGPSFTPHLPLIYPLRKIAVATEMETKTKINENAHKPRKPCRSSTSPLKPVFSMSSTPKSLTVLLSALMAGGCANCDPYSAHPSLGCLVSLNALALAALGPHAMMSEVLAERRDDAQRENTWKRLQANDPQTVADCVIKCNLPTNIEKDHKKRDEIDAHNANQVISWWAAHPLPEQIPALMQAYLYKGAESMQSDPSTANVFLRKATKLAMNPGMPTGTPTSPPNAWTYTYTAEKIQRNLLVLRYRALLKPQPDTGDFQCQAIAAWPPPWLQENADDGLRRSCRLAFNDLFHQWPGPNDRLAVVPGIFAPLSAQEN